MNAIFFVVIAANLIFLSTITTINILELKTKGPPSAWLVKTTAGVTGGNFFFLSLSFSIISYKILDRLRKDFPSFYQSNRCTIILANIGLTVPLLVRGTIDIMRGFSTDFEEHVWYHQAKYNIFLFVCGDLIPISFQFSSLVFGYIRKKGHRLHSEEPDRDEELDDPTLL